MLTRKVSHVEVQASVSGVSKSVLEISAMYQFRKPPMDFSFIHSRLPLDGMRTAIAPARLRDHDTSRAPLNVCMGKAMDRRGNVVGSSQRRLIVGF